MKGRSENIGGRRNPMCFGGFFISRAISGRFGAALLGFVLLIGSVWWPTPVQSQSRGAPTVGRPTETPIAAVWVTREQLFSPQRVDAVINWAQENGVRILYVQAVARGNTTYLSDALPFVYPTQAFDAFAYIVPRAHQAGLEVHAWVSTFLVWSSYEIPRERNHPLQARGEWLSYNPLLHLDSQWETRLHAEEFRSGVYLKPEDPQVRLFVMSLVEEIAQKYAVDGFLLDYVQYPSNDYRMDDQTRQAFRSEYSVDPPLIPRPLFHKPNQEELLWGLNYPDNDPLVGEFAPPILEPPPDVTEMLTDFLPEIRDPDIPVTMGFFKDGEERAEFAQLYKNWVIWRAKQVSLFVRDVSRVLYTKNPGLYLGAAVIPDIAHARNDLGQDWTLWMREGWLDYVVPKLYAANNNLVRDQLSNSMAATSSIALLPAFAVYNQTPGAVAAKIIDAENMGVSGVSLFSWDVLAREKGYWSRLKKLLEKRNQ